MKKLFIVLLLTALVPFAVGCNGLFGTDSDGDGAYWPPVSSKLVSKSITVTFPKSVTGGSLRAADTTTLKPSMTINGQTVYGKVINAATNEYRFTFHFSHITFATLNNLTYATVTIMDDSGKAITFQFKGLDFSGTGSVVSITAITTAGAEVTVDGNKKSTAPITKVIKINEITSNASSLLDAITPDTAVTVNSLTPSFVVSLSEAKTSISGWQVVVTKVNKTWTEDRTGTSVDQNSGSFTYTDGTSVTFDSLGNQFNVGNGKEVTIEVTATGRQLTADTLYRVSLKDGAKINGKPVGQFTVYIKTAATAVALAKLASLDVNGTSITKANFGTETTGVAVKSGNTTTTVIALTFDKAITTAPTAGSITLTKGGATFATFSLADATITIVNGKLVVTFNQPFTANTSYVATLNNPSWTGVDTTATTVSFKTAATN